MKTKKESEILWEGENLAIVKFKGSSFYGGSMSGTNYNPMEIVLMHKAFKHSRNTIDIPRDRYRNIFEGGEGRRFLKADLEALIVEASALDQTWAADLAKLNAARTEAQHANEALRDADDNVRHVERNLLQCARSDAPGFRGLELEDWAARLRETDEALKTAKAWVEMADRAFENVRDRHMGRKP